VSAEVHANLSKLGGASVAHELNTGTVKGAVVQGRGSSVTADVDERSTIFVRNRSLRRSTLCPSGFVRGDNLHRSQE
jgi:hypothetical protein